MNEEKNKVVEQKEALETLVALNELLCKNMNVITEIAKESMVSIS